MDTIFGAMSGFAILISFGYLLLTIFILVYFFRMANDVRELKKSLDEIRDLLVKKDWKEESQKKDTEKTVGNKKPTINVATKYPISALVVNIKSGKQMRIKEITEDGKYSCYTNNGTVCEGDFDETEIKLFESPKYCDVVQ